MNNGVALLQCNGLYKAYQEGETETVVLRDLDFTMQAGQMIAILGSSGSGKSTLLHLLGGLDAPSSGEILFNGVTLSSLSASEKALLRNREIGFIWQFHHLLPDFNALENVAMPLLIGKKSKKEAQEMAYEMLQAVKLEQRATHRPSALSGGERQRVAIARALVNSPRLVLADEPTGNLDVRNADIIFELLSELNVKKGIAFLVVTHDLNLASRLPQQREMQDGHLSNEVNLVGAA